MVLHRFTGISYRLSDLQNEMCSGGERVVFAIAMVVSDGQKNFAGILDPAAKSKERGAQP